MYFYDVKECGQRIRSLRISRGMTQELLANRLNTTTDHLIRIEGGKRGCSIDLLVVMVNFFDVSMDFLMFGCEHKNEAAKDDLSKIIDALEMLKERI